jgi:hypothetical protein
MQAGGLQPLLTKDAGSIGPCEWCRDKITDLDFADIAAHGLDNTDKFMSHAVAGLAGHHLLIRPEIAAADGRTCDDYQGVGWFNDSGIRDVLDTDIPGTIHYSCTHNNYLQLFSL